MIARMRELAFAVWVICGWVGCLYDGDSRCDSDQVLSSDGYCICREGSVLDGSRCVSCGQGQVVVKGRCACAEGLVPQGDTCVAAQDKEQDAGPMSGSDPTPTGQGMRCTAGGGECDGLDADYCESALLGQCLVKGCTVGGADCSVGWTCCNIAAAGTTLCLEQARLMQELGSSSCPKF
jgi:hypothetical protein